MQKNSKIIQITNTYRDDVLTIVQSCVPEGFIIRTLSENTEENLIQCVSEADYILASGRVKISKSVLEAAKNLKMVQRTGVGLDSLDIKAIYQKGIPVYVNKGVNSYSVAEHTILLILACLRNFPEINYNTKSGCWIKQAQGIKNKELRCCTVGVIGMGNVGKAVASYLKAFGASVYYYDVCRLSEEQEQQLGIKYSSCGELMEKADIITLHCPLTEETKGIICKNTLQKMRDGVIIINTARGKLINEDDLLLALQSGKVGFAGLDVFEEEPPQNMALLKHKKVIATPHIAGITYNSFYQMIQDAMRNIRLYDEGEFQEIEEYKLNLGD